MGASQGPKLYFTNQENFKVGDSFRTLNSAELYMCFWRNLDYSYKLVNYSLLFRDQVNY